MVNFTRTKPWTIYPEPSVYYKFKQKSVIPVFGLKLRSGCYAIADAAGNPFSEIMFTLGEIA